MSYTRLVARICLTVVPMVLVAPVVPLTATPAVAAPQLTTVPQLGAPPTDCDIAFSTDTPFRDGGDTTKIEAAARRLEADGAQVRVRAFAKVPDGDLDRYMTEVGRGCDWGQAPNLRSDMIVLAVSIDDRKTGLYFGSRWHDQLSSRWHTIQEQQINPPFRRGDYVAGLVAGLDAVRAAISTTGGGQQAGGGQETGAGQETAAGQETGGEQGSDSSGPGPETTGAIVMAVITALTLAMFAATVLPGRRKRAAARASAVDAASAAEQELARLAAAEALFDRLAGRLGELGEAKAFTKAGAKTKAATKALAKAQRHFAKCAEQDPPDRIAGYDRSAATRAGDRWGGCYHQLRQANATVEQARSALDRLLDEVDRLGDRLYELRQRCTGTAGTLGDLARQGWMVEQPRADVEAALGLVDQASAALAGARSGEALDGTREAATRLEAAEREAERLPRRRPALIEALGDLERRSSAALAGLDLARSSADQLGQRYGQSCVEDLELPGTTVGADIAEAIAAGLAAAGMDQQRWSDADRHRDTTKGLVERAEQAQRKVEELRIRLEELAAGLRSLLAETRQAVATAQATLDHSASALPAKVRAELQQNAKVMQGGLLEESNLAGRAQPPLVRLGRSLPQLIEYAQKLEASVHRHRPPERISAPARGSRGSHTAAVIGSEAYVASSYDSSWSSSFDSSSSYDSSSSFDSGSSSSSYDGGSSSW